MAICLDMANDFEKKYPDRWADALDVLARQKTVMDVLSKSPTPAAEILRKKAAARGLKEQRQ